MEEQRAKEAEERLVAEEKAREARRPRHHELEWDVLAEDETVESRTALHTQLKALESQPVRGEGDPEAYDFDDADKKEARCLKELREKLGDMKIVSRAKVTVDRVYSSAYHPTNTKDLIFFGGTFRYRRFERC